MIEYYLTSNNEMCYSAKTQTFSPTKHTLSLCPVSFQMRPMPDSLGLVEAGIFFSFKEILVRSRLEPSNFLFEI